MVKDMNERMDDILPEKNVFESELARKFLDIYPRHHKKFRVEDARHHPDASTSHPTLPASLLPTAAHAQDIYATSL